MRLRPRQQDKREDRRKTGNDRKVRGRDGRCGNSLTVSGVESARDAGMAVRDWITSPYK